MHLESTTALKKNKAPIISTNINDYTQNDTRILLTKDERTKKRFRKV
jgi:prephenate dehydratase